MMKIRFATPRLLSNEMENYDGSAVHYVKSFHYGHFCISKTLFAYFVRKFAQPTCAQVNTVQFR